MLHFWWVADFAFSVCVWDYRDDSYNWQEVVECDTRVKSPQHEVNDAFRAHRTQPDATPTEGDIVPRFIELQNIICIF